MRENNVLKWMALFIVIAIMNACGVDIPKETESSFETMVVNPGKILLNAVASLTQPIYAQGKLKANLKISQLTQENLMNKYVQTVIEAGSEVNDALADCQVSGGETWLLSPPGSSLKRRLQGNA